MSVLVGLFLWLISIFLVRNRNFHQDGSRKFPTRSNSTESASKEIEYHNNAIYRDFEFFFKVTLGIIGGMAFIATREKSGSPETVAYLIKTGASLQIVAGFLFSIFIIAHEKSKIERWTVRFSLWDTLTWQECWMVVAIFLISGTVFLSVAPILSRILFP